MPASLRVSFSFLRPANLEIKMTAKDRIRWGIFGCGNVTEVKSGTGFQKADGSELVAVMRRDAVQAEDYAKRHNVARWFSDADSLMWDPSVDAVYIATPVNLSKLRC